MITLQIQVKSEPVTRRIKLSKEVSDEFDFYVKAATEKTPRADESLVLEAILKNHFRKDKWFRNWLKSRDAQNQDGP
ncbi:MAG: hypothetical protein HGB35_06570 [Geobacteraceae bacterium]|nr:hypothetical protein [Geobacteraceae bacterium]